MAEGKGRREKAEGKRQKGKGRREKAEGKRQKGKGRREKAEGGEADLRVFQKFGGLEES
jgi:hypothetical protein